MKTEKSYFVCAMCEITFDKVSTFVHYDGDISDDDLVVLCDDCSERVIEDAKKAGVKLPSVFFNPKQETPPKK